MYCLTDGGSFLLSKIILKNDGRQTGSWRWMRFWFVNWKWWENKIPSPALRLVLWLRQKCPSRILPHSTTLYNELFVFCRRNTSMILFLLSSVNTLRLSLSLPPLIFKAPILKMSIQSRKKKKEKTARPPTVLHPFYYARASTETFPHFSFPSLVDVFFRLNLFCLLSSSWPAVLLIFKMELMNQGKMLWPPQTVFQRFPLESNWSPVKNTTADAHHLPLFNIYRV